MKRTDAREKAFQYIYSKLFNIEASLELDENDENTRWATSIASTFDSSRGEIEELISKNLKGYTLSRLNKVDLSIIILAIIEIKYLTDEPKQIVINEAVELAKKFSTEKSPKFINGFLAGLVN